MSSNDSQCKEQATADGSEDEEGGVAEIGGDEGVGEDPGSKQDGGVTSSTASASPRRRWRASPMRWGRGGQI